MTVAAVVRTVNGGDDFRCGSREPSRLLISCEGVTFTDRELVIVFGYLALSLG